MTWERPMIDCLGRSLEIHHKSLGLPNQWVRNIMQCVESARHVSRLEWQMARLVSPIQRHSPMGSNIPLPLRALYGKIGPCYTGGGVEVGRWKPIQLTRIRPKLWHLFSLMISSCSRKRQSIKLKLS